MAQVRRQTRNPSPPPRQIPPLPNAIRFRPPPLTNVQRTQNSQVNDQPPHARSPNRPVHQQQFVNHQHPPPPRTGQTGVFYHSNNTKYDSLTGLLINNNTTTNNNYNNENYEQSYVISSSVNHLPSHERQLPPPRPQRPPSEDVYSLQQHEPLRLNNNEVCEISLIFK
jgi:hypothetical protein